MGATTLYWKPPASCATYNLKPPSEAQASVASRLMLAWPESQAVVSSACTSRRRRSTWDRSSGSVVHQTSRCQISRRFKWPSTQKATRRASRHCAPICALCLYRRSSRWPTFRCLPQGCLGRKACSNVQRRPSLRSRAQPSVAPASAAERAKAGHPFASPGRQGKGILSRPWRDAFSFTSPLASARPSRPGFHSVGVATGAHTSHPSGSRRRPGCCHPDYAPGQLGGPRKPWVPCTCPCPAASSPLTALRLPATRSLGDAAVGGRSRPCLNVGTVPADGPLTRNRSLGGELD